MHGAPVLHQQKSADHLPQSDSNKKRKKKKRQLNSVAMKGHNLVTYWVLRNPNYGLHYTINGFSRWYKIFPELTNF